MLRALVSLLVPGGLLVAGAVLGARWFVFPEPLPEVYRFAPSAILLAGVLFGARFRRSQMVLACVLLGFADWSLMLFDGSGRLAPPAERVIFTAVSILVPLNFLLLSLSDDRGIFSRVGLSRLLLVLCQPFLVAWITLPWPGELAASLERELFAMVLVSPVAQVGWVAFATAFCLLVIQYFMDRNDAAAGMAWALAALLVALHAEPGAPEARLFIATAGVVLVVSQIESFHRLAYRDELTELPSRRALNAALLDLQHPYAAAMVDLDHFKRFNDGYGHDVGDQLLRMVAFKLAAVPGGGKAYRYGGEEFVVLYPGRRIDDALPHLEALRMTIEETPFTLRGPRRKKGPPRRKSTHSAPRPRVAVTISISIAESGPRLIDPDQVIRAADQALYRAKDAGRNRVSV